MARARKAAAPARKAAAGKHTGGLQKLIEDLIDAKRADDYERRKALEAELEKYSPSARHLQEAAAEAREAAKHPVLVDSLRELTRIKAQVERHG